MIPHYRVRYRLDYKAVPEYYIEKQVKTIFRFITGIKRKWIKAEHEDYGYGIHTRTYKCVDEAKQRIKQLIQIDGHGVDPVVWTDP